MTGCEIKIDWLVYILLTSLLFKNVIHCASSASGNGGAQNIAFISITTDDLEASLKFYTQVLGGMRARELSFTLFGTDHYQLLFQQQLEEARRRGVDPATLGVPDITDTGAYQMKGEMVILDNGIIQLVQFVPRDPSGPAFSAHETRTSPAYIAAPHVCFWVQDDVDFNQYIAAVEKRSAELGLTNVKFNRPVEVHSEAEREAVPEDQLGLTFNTGDFAGLSFAYFKGPRGEQLELYRLRNQTRHYFGRDVCRRGGVAKAYMDDYADNQWKKAAGLSGRLFGIMQFGTRTDDLWRSVKFYVEEMGAHLVQKPLQATNVRGDDVENMLFQKELLDAQAWGVEPLDVGVANISDAGSMRLDHRFSLFDNFVVETLLYTDGLTLDADPPFNPRYNHSSLAYTNDMSVALSLPHLADFNATLLTLQRNLDLHGFQEKVKANSLQGQGQQYLTLTHGPLSGLSYAVVGGPAGEHVMLVQLGGEMREKVKRAFQQYGSVSTEFVETGAVKDGRDRMHEFCKQFPSAGVIG